MNFANTVAIIISGPFFLAVADGRVGTDDVVVSLPFIGVDLGSGQGEGVDVAFQGFTVRVVDDPQASLTRFSAHRPDDRRTVIGIGSVADLFIGSAARGISWIAVIVTFFPPHSETFHPFQSGYHLKEFEVDAVPHWLGFLGGLGARFGG
jgi:hypothetical protein